MDKDAFIKWAQDLTDRCTEHLKQNPEPFQPEQKLLPSFPESKSIGAGSRGIVIVTESLHFPGAWCVFRGATKLTTFFGYDAHQRASKYAGDILADR